MAEIPPNARLQRNPQVVARELADTDGGVLLHLETGAYHRLNQVGFVIWTLLEDEPTVTDLIVGVRERVADAPPELEQDVLGFVRLSLDRDLLRVVA